MHYTLEVVEAGRGYTPYIDYCESIFAKILESFVSPTRVRVRSMAGSRNVFRLITANRALHSADLAGCY